MLTVWANTGPPPLILLEDLVDLCDILDSIGRTIPPNRWVADEIMKKEQREFQAMQAGLGF